MKIFNKLNLQWRLTILSGMTMLLMTLTLTFVSNYSAQKKFQTFASDNKMLIFDYYNVSNGETFGLNASLVESDSPIFVEKIESTNSNIAMKIDLAAVESASDFTTQNYFFAFVIGILSMIATYFISAKALEPVKELNKTIFGISEHNANERLIVRDSNDEISSMAKEFNHMLDRLDEAYVAQKSFSTNISHEIKTPLAIMKSSIQVVENMDEPQVEDYQKMMKTTHKNVMRLINIVDDLFSLTNEYNSLEFEYLSLEAQIKSIIKDLEVMYVAKNVKITYNSELKELMIKGNETLVYRSFYNLIENAFKYNVDNGSINISVDEDIDYYVCKIVNSSKGIQAEELSKIFNPFYCVDSSRSRDLGGAGLGLSIVKNIVEKHGWEIEVESIIDNETSFLIKIPKAMATPCA